MKRFLSFAMMPLALAVSSVASAIDCSPATPQTTVIYCNDFENSNTPWANSVTYYQMDSTPIATRYDGTETRVPSTIVPSLIRQQASVETIRINNQTPPFYYTDGGAENYAIGMLTGTTPTSTDRLTFTFDALDRNGNIPPHVIVELDAATIPLLRFSGGPPHAERGVSGTPNVFQIDAYDESTGDFVQSGAVLAPDASIVKIASASQTLAASAPIAGGFAPPPPSYDVVWKKGLTFILDLSAIAPITNPNGTITLLFDHPPTNEYVIFDNLKISATNKLLQAPATPVPATNRALLLLIALGLGGLAYRQGFGRWSARMKR